MHTSTYEDPVIPQLGRYDIDTSQSAVTFTTRHLFGLGPVTGTFGFRTGYVAVAEPATESAAYAEIETASFRTGNGQRDHAVVSPRFLDARTHPVMVVRLSRLDPGSRGFAGTLTVREVTRPVSLTIAECAADGRSFTARAAARIDRTEFGVTASRGLAARYLQLTVEVRCVRM
jgi:polyisoprenoid-binding protein YceI